MVPIYEEQSARLESRYTLQEWASLDRIEKAMIVAIRRIGNSMKNLQTEAEIKANKRKIK